MIDPVNSPLSAIGFVPQVDSSVPTTITINDFLTSISTATQDHREAIYDALFKDPQNTLLLYKHYAETTALLASNLGTQQDRILAQAAAWSIVRNQQVAIFSAITTYNTSTRSALQSAINNLNDAIDDYNAIDPPTAQSIADLNAARTTYNNNNAVKNSLPAYNSTAAAYNSFAAVIPALNDEASNLGMPSLSTSLALLSSVPTVAPARTDPPMSNVPNAAIIINIVVSPPAPSGADALSQYYYGATNILFRALGIISQNRTSLGARLALQNALSQFNRKNVTLPAGAEIQHSLSFQTLGAPPGGTGALIGQMVVGLGEPALEGILASARYGIESFLQAKGFSGIRRESIDQLLLLGVLAIQGAAAKGAESISSQLSVLSIKPEDLQNFVNNASGFAFAEQIIEAIKSGALLAAVTAIFEGIAASSAASAQPSESGQPASKSAPEGEISPLAGLSSEELKALATSISPLLAIFLLQAAINQVALAIGAPGLISQVFVNIDGRPISLPLVPSSAAERLNIALHNGPTLAAIQRRITEDLVHTGVAPQTAQNIAITVLNSSIQKEAVTSREQFTELLTQNLIKEGITQKQAQSAVQVANQVLTEEIQFPYLDQGLNVSTPTALEESLRKINIQAVAQLPSEVSPIQVPLFQRALQLGAQNPALGLALASSLQAPNITIRDFIGSLQENLTAAGISAEKAAPFTAVVTALLAPPSASPSEHPIESPVQERALSRDALIESVNQLIASKLTTVVGPGLSNVQAQANRVVLDILETFNEQNRLVQRLSREKSIDEGYLERYHADLRDFSNPDLAAYVTSSELTQIIKSQVEAVQAYMFPETQADLRTANIPISGPPSIRGRGWMDIPI